MSAYRPIFRKQIGDPTTTLDSYLCTMESGAMALDYHTLGRVQKWGGELVRYCGLTARQIMGLDPRADGKYHVGTSLPVLAQAWAHYGATLEVRQGQNWAYVVAALNQGRAVVLQGLYSQLGAYSCQSNFRGAHAIMVLPGWLVGDSLCNTFKYVPQSVLRAYAEKFSAQVGTSSILFAATMPHAISEAPVVKDVTMIIPAIKGEDWVPQTNPTTGASNGVFRANPSVTSPIFDRVAVGTIVRSIAEVQTTTIKDNNWRVTEHNGRTAYMLRRDWNPVVPGGDPVVDAGLTSYIDRK